MPETIIVNRIFNCIPSRDTEKDWRVSHAREAGMLAAEPAIPASKDLRESWWDVGNQGNTGSCVGWATADSVLRWHFVKAGRLNSDEHLSVRFLWMAAKETDEFVDTPTTFIELEGTSLKAALDIARKYGIVKDSDLPFGKGDLYQGKTETFYALASQFKIANYINLHNDLDHWREWIAHNGPILARLNVDATWDNASGDANLEVYQSDRVKGGHAVAIVGYTPDRFIIRNSWGTQYWGDQGFAYASIDYINAAFNEAYGVTI